MCAFINEVLLFLDTHCPTAIVPAINFIMGSPKIKELVSGAVKKEMDDITTTIITAISKKTEVPNIES